jgi:cAMP-dependent protein kinase regulator
MGSEYFVLFTGRVRVTVYKPGTNAADPNLEDMVSFEKELGGENADPIGFGEIALLYNDKRTASITAIDDCETWVLSGDVFKQIIAINSIRRRNISLEYLDKVELFKPLEQYEKLKLIDGLKVINAAAGDFIFHQGDTGDHFYIIEEGTIECGFEKEQPDGTNSFDIVRTLSQGDHFGEIALINGVRRTLAVRSGLDSTTQLLSLTRQTFTRILGSIKQYLKEDYGDDR